MMDKTKRNKQIFRIGILTFTVLVCAWLLPISVGIASATSSTMKVSLTVTDAIGVNYGTAAFQSEPGGQVGQEITEFVARAASSRLSSGIAVDELKGSPSNADHDVSQGPGTKTGLGGADSSGYDFKHENEGIEVVITVSNL